MNLTRLTTELETNLRKSAMTTTIKHKKGLRGTSHMMRTCKVSCRRISHPLAPGEQNVFAEHQIWLYSQHNTF